MMTYAGDPTLCFCCPRTAWCDSVACPDCKVNHLICSACFLDGMSSGLVTVNASNNTLVLLACLRPMGIGRTLETG